MCVLSCSRSQDRGPAAADDLVTLTNQGVGLMGQFDFARAREVFMRAAATHPERSDFQVNLALATLNRQQDGDAADARQIFERVLGADPKQLRAHYGLGLLLLNDGRAGERQTASIDVEVQLQYRKFTRGFTKYALGPGAPPLPVTTIASDRIVFPIAGAAPPAAAAATLPPAWERWNDYGIALLLEGSSGSEKGELRQAADAFSEVERLGRPDGPLNLARVFHKEGRLDEAVEALRRAAAAGATPWTVAWLSGLVNKENGFLDQAIDDFTRVLASGPAAGAARRFDFTADYEVINELGQTLYERAKVERGAAHGDRRRQYLRRAADQFEKTLTIDAENMTAHYVLSLIYGDLGEATRSAEHAALHARYKPDDNARDHAVATHRMSNPAANHAAQSIVIYPLR